MQSCSNARKNNVNSNNEISTLDTVITYSIENYSQLKPPIIKLFAKNNIWTVSKYRIFINQLYGDSLVKDCVNCPKIFDEIVKLGLFDLLNETDLKKDCVAYKHFVLNGDSVVQITNMNLTEDNSLHRIEYSIGNKKRTLVYRDPVEALTICPDSEERIKFLKIIRLMEGL